MAEQDLGALGTREGPPVKISCAVVDSLRGVVGWLPLLLLLSVRKANRNRQAWALLVPLVAIYLVFGVAERLLNGYLIFHYHQYICSAVADLVRYLGVSMAVLLTFSDVVTPPWRWLRFVLVLFFLFLAVNVQITANAWPFLTPGTWATFFGVFLLIFLTGHSVVQAVLRRLVGPDLFIRWYGAFCLLVGTLPLLILGAVEWKLSRSIQLSSTLERYRVIVVLASALSLPWFVLFWFILLAARIPLYRERLARALGVRSMKLEEMPPPPIARISMAH